MAKAKEPRSEAVDDKVSNAAADSALPPATTLRLIIGAIAMQAGSKLVSDVVERSVHGKTSASGTPMAKPGKIKTTAASKLARIATQSKPGAIAIAGGLLVKHIFDRGGKRLQAKREAAKRP